MTIDLLKTKLKQHPHVSRVLKAKNYPTVSFNHRDIGRFQVRYHGPSHEWPNGYYEIYHNHDLVGGPYTLRDISVVHVLHICDMWIDSHEHLRTRANPTPS